MNEILQWFAIGIALAMGLYTVKLELDFGDKLSKALEEMKKDD